MSNHFFNKKAFSNKLTKSIKEDPDFSLEDTLIHEDLSPTIRNESDVLYQRILCKDEPWFNKIFDYALFGKTPPKAYKKYNSINQINKNAANFLENCGRKFIQYFKESKDENLIKPEDLTTKLKKNITNFISEDNEINQNPLYAGNFQRFIENFLRWEALDADEIIPKLTSFLVNNCRILAYQQLITRIISDYNGVIGETTYDLLTKMLYRSYMAVKYIRSQNDPDIYTTAVSVVKAVNKAENLTEDTQPLNLSKKPIPLINVVFDQSENVQDLNDPRKNPSIKWKESSINKKNKIEYEDIEDAEIEAYLLIMSIRSSINDQIEVISHFRDDEENNYPLIQALLYCGTRSHVKSLVSLESFRLLSIIFNGSVPLNIEPWKSTEEEKSQLDFYKKYADEMFFDPTILTYKMIHALPVFWNHRYNEDTYELSEDEKEKVNIKDYYKDKKKHIRSRKPGETALEILQPCLLCEPPISSQLIYFCTDIFIQLSKTRRQIYKEENLSEQDRDLLVKLDGIVLDFYQHHFTYGKKYRNTTLSELAKNVIVPLEPSNEAYQEDDKKRRASLSGFAVDFFLRMTSMRTNTFFQIDIEQIIADMGRRKCFSANNAAVFFKYQNLTNYMKLKESTLYNKPIHSDFCFENDEDDEDVDVDDQMVAKIIVDENSKGYSEIFGVSSKKNENKGKNKGKAQEKIKEEDDDDDDDDKKKRKKATEGKKGKGKGKGKSSDSDSDESDDEKKKRKKATEGRKVKSSDSDDDDDGRKLRDNENLSKSYNDDRAKKGKKPGRSRASYRPQKSDAND